MSFFRVFSISLLSQALVLLIGFVNSIIITRNLDLAGRGSYALTMNIILILGLIVGDGLYRSNTYLVSKDRDRLSRLLTNGVVAIVGMGILFFVMLWGVGKAVIPQILPGVDFQLMILVGISAIPLVFIRSICGLFLGLQRYYAFNLLVVAPLALYGILNVGSILWSTISPSVVLSNYAVAMFVMMVVALFMILRTETIRFKASWSVGKQSFLTGLKSSASTILLFLLFRVDIFLINYFLGTEQAGLYSIAIIISELLQKFANTSGTVIFPKIAGSKDAREGRALSYRVLIFVCVVGIVFAALLYLVGGKLIVLLFKERFAMAVHPLHILLPGTVVMAMGKIILFSLWGQGFPRITVLLPLVSFILNIFLNLMLIPRYGITGAAISTSVSYVVFGVTIFLYHLLSRPAEFREKIQPVL